MREKIDYADYFAEMMNAEITKLRKEIYDECYLELMSMYDEIDVKKALLYFYAIPIMNSLNRKSFDMLKECCEVAKTHRLNLG